MGRPVPGEWCGRVIFKTPCVAGINPESRAVLRDQPVSQPRAGHRPLQIYPLVTDLAADSVPVEVTPQGVGIQHARLIPLENQPGNRTGLDRCALGQRRP